MYVINDAAAAGDSPPAAHVTDDVTLFSTAGSKRSSRSDGGGKMAATSDETLTSLDRSSSAAVGEKQRCSFYCAMHFSAKRGIAIACRLSVRPSVCLSVCNVGEL